MQKDWCLAGQKIAQQSKLKNQGSEEKGSPEHARDEHCAQERKNACYGRAQGVQKKILSVTQRLRERRRGDRLRERRRGERLRERRRIESPK